MLLLFIGYFFMEENILERDYFSYGKIYHKIYYESCDEFEQVRKYCLEEDNWLRENYTEKNLVIEDHKGYCVIYSATTNEPLAMGGVFNDGRWPSNTARMLNRAFIFQPIRRGSIRQLIAGSQALHDHMVMPLIKVNNYDSYFITMQNRDKKSTKGWWDVWRHVFNRGSKGFWTEQEGYVQTCPHMVQKCWQNFVYHEMIPGSFNLPVINQEEWDQLIPGN